MYSVKKRRYKKLFVNYSITCEIVDRLRNYLNVLSVCMTIFQTENSNRISTKFV